MTAVLFSLAIGTGAAVDAQRQKWHAVFRAILLFVGIAVVATSDDAAKAGLVIAVGAAFAIDHRGWRSLLSASAGGLGALVALEVAWRYLGSDLFAVLPPSVAFIGAGAGFGLAMAAPMALSHLEVVGDAVSRRYRAVWAATSGEVQDLVSRGYGVWNQSTDLPEGDENRALLEEAVLRLFNTAETWTAANKSADSTSEASLRDRMISLKERIESTTDEQARREYEQAHTALGEQLKYLDGIRTSRERVIARLHNYLAAMERLRLALVSAQSSRGAIEVAPMATTLAEIGRDLESELRD